MNRLRAWSPLLAIPLTILLVLVVGGRLSRVALPEPDEMPPRPVLARQAPDDLRRDLRLQFMAADGTPGAGAHVAVIDPVACAGIADADGQVHLRLVGEGPYRILAHLQGHTVLAPEPFLEADLPFQFAILDTETADRPAPMAPIRPLPVFLVDRDGRPLPGALVLWVPTEEGRRTPRWALSDEEGAVVVAHARDESATLRAYLPDAPPLPAFLLGERQGTWEEIAGPADWTLPSAAFRLNGLQPGTLVACNRTDQPARLPYRVADPAGAAKWDLLPIGTYRFETEGVVFWEGALEPGTLTWEVTK